MQCLCISVRMCVRECVCVVKGDPWLSWLWLGIGAGGGEDTIRPWFLWLWWHPDNSRHIHNRYTCTSISSALSLPPLAFHSHTHTHIQTQTHTPGPENYSLACKHWADGLPNDCCVQCRGSVLLSHYTFPLQLTRPQSAGLAFIYFMS